MFSITKAALLALGFTAASAKFDQFFYAHPFEGLCATGEKQTPINLKTPEITEGPAEWATELHFPKVSELAVKNTGHGMEFPAEMHIVSAVAFGEASEWGCDAFWLSGDAADLNLEKCITVFGVMFKYGATTPRFIKDMLAAAPLGAGEMTHINGTLDLNSVLPFNREYYTYEGSLTTPPCAEGLRWHVFKTPLTMTEADVEAMQQFVADTFDPEHPENTLVYRMNNRPIQPVFERDVFHISA